MADVRGSLLWGAVSGLAFLVLALGYRLLTSATPSFAVLLPVAGAVAVGGAALAYATVRALNGRV